MNKSATAAQPRIASDFLWLLFCLYFISLGLASNLLAARNRIFDAAQAGDIGAQFVRTPGPGAQHFSIAHLAVDSPLRAYGMHEGDLVQLDHAFDDVRTPLAGETLGLTLLSPAGAHVLVAVPRAAPIISTERVASILNLMANLSMLGVGLFVVWRASRNRGLLALGLSLIGNGAALAFKWPTSAATYPYWHAAIWGMLQLVPWLFLRFTLGYVGDRVRRIRSWEYRALEVLVALEMLLATLETYSFLTNYNFRWLPRVDSLYFAMADCGALLALGYLVAGWMRGGADARKRLTLIVLGLSMTIAPVVVFISYGNHFPSLFEPAILVSFCSQSIGPMLFAYAIFRHRILDLGFAINRTVVYGVVTALLLTAFGLIEWAVDHLIRIEGREKSALIDAGIAVGVFLTFHRVRDAVEHGIESVLFRSWHENEALLRRFIRDAGHVRKQEALIHAFMAELTRFCGGAQAALYFPDAEGHYSLAAGRIPGVEDVLDEDQPELVRLRANPETTECKDALEAQVQLNLAMVHRHQMIGVVLLGPKPGGNDYRPDEMEVLLWATRQIGLSLHALKVEALERSVRSMEQIIATQSAQLRFAEALQARGPT